MITRNDIDEVFDGKGRRVSATPVTRDVTLEVNESVQSQRALDAIAGLRQIKGTTGTLTGAQLSNAVRLLATVALVLVRRAYDRHDEDD